MLFNLEEFITPNTDVVFDSLEVPFTKEEIDNIVKGMLANKSLGPDGFNGTFLQKCCNIVKDLSTNFGAIVMKETELNLESINTAFITLIPKKQNPEYGNDYIGPFTLPIWH